MNTLPCICLPSLLSTQPAGNLYNHNMQEKHWLHRSLGQAGKVCRCFGQRNQKVTGSAVKTMTVTQTT